MRDRIKQWYAVLIILALWAVIFLSNLDLNPISHNEARRIFPAISMLESGNWRTPILAGGEYLRKPPLMNWMVAASFLITGEYSDFTARLPTVLMVLSFALLLVLLPSRRVLAAAKRFGEAGCALTQQAGILTPNARFFSAIIFLTTPGMIRLGRTANIDPNYVCVTGMAILFWLNAWAKDNYGWRMWIVPSVMLGLGLLLKGPLILLLFYIMVIAILHNSQKLRSIISLPHFAGLLIMFFIFGIWSFYSSCHGTETPAVSPRMTEVWYSEIMHRFNFGELKFSRWAARVGGGFAQFLPWILLAPLIYFKKFLDGFNDKEKIFLKSALFAIPTTLFLVHAMPVTKSRYSLPLLPLLAITLGLLLTGIKVKEVWLRFFRTVLLSAALLISATSCVVLFLISVGWLSQILDKLPEIRECLRADVQIALIPTAVIVFSVICITWGLFKFKKSLHDINALVLVLGCLIGLSVLFWTVSIMPFSTEQEARDFADKINACTSPSSTIYGVDYVGREPYVFYIKRKTRIVASFKEISEKANYILVEENLLSDLEKYEKNLSLHEVSREEIPYYKDYDYKYFLIHLEDERNGNDKK